MGLFDFLTRRSRGIPTTEAADRLVVSVAMVKELIEIYRSRGFARDPRAKMIGRHLWQLGGEGSLQVAKDKILQELGTKALSELNEIWRDTKNEERDPTSALEIMKLERAGSVFNRLVGKDAANLENIIDDTGKLKRNVLDDAMESYERDKSNAAAALAAMTKKLPKR